MRRDQNDSITWKSVARVWGVIFFFLLEDIRKSDGSYQRGRESGGSQQCRGERVGMEARKGFDTERKDWTT